MAKHEDYEQKTEVLVLPILEKFGCTLVDVEYVKEAGDYYLRLYIDKENGVNILDCENVSRALSDKMDENDFIPDAYILEVSSPGLGRPLKKDKDYVRNTGKLIEIHLYHAEDKNKELVGILQAFSKVDVTLLVDSKEVVVDKKNISLIREYVDWDADLK